RIVSFAVPAIWLSGRPGFELRHLWYLSVATVLLQMTLSLLLLRRELGKRLDGRVAEPPVPPVPPVVAGVAPEPAGEDADS
ncbi:MAG: MATE family efflux transporter, partial [Acidobacteriota bacterium]